MKKTFILIFVFSTLLLSGCSTVNTTQTRSQMENLLIVEPVPASTRSQLAIARYNQILAQAPLSDEERAQLFFQRGMLYDNLGLSGLAVYDFRKAISLKPDLAEAHNSIGIHYTQQQEFIQAYESFDSTLDINPDFDFAFLNRGIALYYGGRPDLAAKDLDTFLSRNNEDPYRAIWRYLAKSEVNKLEAVTELREARAQLNPGHWAIAIVDLFLGDISEAQLLNVVVVGVTNQRQLTDRLCEVYFYLGKYHSAQSNKGKASTFFKLALSTNVYEYVEHRYARLELNLLRDKAFRESQAQ